MQLVLRNRDEIERAKVIEAETLAHWDNKFRSTMDVLVAHNAYYREKQIGLGKGKSEGPEGVVEARIPLHFLLMNLEKSVDLIQDDKQWYPFLRKHPELRAFEYGRKVQV